MPNGNWGRTPKGKANRNYNKLRLRVEAKGLTLNVRPEDFYIIYLNAQKCAMCGKPFGVSYGVLRAIKVSGYGSDGIVKPEHLQIVHLTCSRMGNQNARKN